MSTLDDQLNRLLRAGAKGGIRAEAGPPSGFASRVCSEWRASSANGADLSYAILCKRAVLCSYGVAVLVFFLNIQALESFRERDAWRAADARLIDSAMRMEIP
jgi:hypothetical protein